MTEEATVKRKAPKKLNSRWMSGKQRYGKEDATAIKKFEDERRQGWHRGARVSK